MLVQGSNNKSGLRPFTIQDFKLTDKQIFKLNWHYKRLLDAIKAEYPDIHEHLTQKDPDVTASDFLFLALEFQSDGIACQLTFSESHIVENFKLYESLDPFSGLASGEERREKGHPDIDWHLEQAREGEIIKAWVEQADSPEEFPVFTKVSLTLTQAEVDDVNQSIWSDAVDMRKKGKDLSRLLVIMTLAKPDDRIQIDTVFVDA